MLLNNQWITEEIREEIKKLPRDKLQQKYDNPFKTYGLQQKKF